MPRNKNVFLPTMGFDGRRPPSERRRKTGDHRPVSELEPALLPGAKATAINNHGSSIDVARQITGKPDRHARNILWYAQAMQRNGLLLRSSGGVRERNVD